MNRLPIYIFRFIILVLLQIFIFSQIQFSNLINPYFYVLFVLLLPFDMPRSAMLLMAFFLGLTIDLFSNTLGMHAAACTWMAFTRPAVLKWISPREDYEADTLPTVHYYGLRWFVGYTLVMVFLHHFALFFIEMFRWSDFFATLARVFLSTLFTSFLIVVSQFFFFRK
ncbi:MAG TPA: rod shape-determining protein MreD [Bacteroidales bacterium]|nr:rod shape-determining protein MreD [Bacteroidales bacterium]HOK98291.1 rod shape-determining protein MreD [Bacteroidales bacterium]HPO65153.1 rod shape-determining protein MreD [Bacteroidales bacterium]